MSRILVRVEPPDGPPFEREWDARELAIGRAATSDIVLSDSRASRSHAQLVPEGDAWIVRDLGARNRTIVNGQTIDADRRIRPGDVVRCGDTLIRVLAHPGEPSPSPVHLTEDRRLGSSIVRPAAELLARHEQQQEVPAADAARHAARLRAVNDVHRALASVTSSSELFELLLERLFAVLQPEEGAVLDKDASGEIRVAASRRVDARQPPSPVSRHLVREVIEKGAAALVLDAAVDGRFAEARSVVTSGIRSMVAAPIGDADGCFGMIALYSRAHVRRFAEADLELLVALAAAAALRLRNLALAEDAAARRALDRELALARDIQMSMLPGEALHRADVELAAMLHPARAVGGDLYDFMVLGDTLWFIVADAAGKGVSAALYMAVMRTLFRALARTEASPATLMGRINGEIARDNERQFFVTAIAGQLDLATGRLTYCNAGHPPPLHVTTGGEPRELPGGRAIAAGILEDASYPLQDVTLRPGDRIFLFTDGITEAIDARGEPYSTTRLRNAIAQHSKSDLRAIVDAVLDSIRRFAGETPQEDDITMLALEFKSSSSQLS